VLLSKSVTLLCSEFAESGRVRADYRNAALVFEEIGVLEVGVVR
jgi:hypothetical protein